MKTILYIIAGTLAIVTGIVLGLYLGLWVCFVGGIVSIIEAIKASPVDSLGIALGILRFMVAGLVGWISFFICASVGLVFLFALLLVLACAKLLLNNFNRF
jgi:hypothetical protein